MGGGRWTLLLVLAVVAALTVFVVCLLVWIQGARFEGQVASEARELWRRRSASPAVQRALDELPAPVRRYMEVSGAARRAPVRAVRLQHGGTFRPSLDGPWNPIEGDQYFSADPPGFVWWGRIRVAPCVYVEARDRSLAGEGRMLVRLSSTLTLDDARGPEMDQGALLRLLAEMVWFPTAFLDRRYVSWAPLDERSARATLRVGGRTAAATFRFGPDGLPSGLAAERYRDVEGRGILTPWSGEYGDYREVEGLLLPFRTEVTWHVDGRALPYARWVFERVEFDREEPFPG